MLYGNDDPKGHKKTANFFLRKFEVVGLPLARQQESSR